MSQKLWVKHNTVIDQITTEHCNDVADLIDKITARSKLGIPFNSVTNLFKPDGTTKIEIADNLNSLDTAGKEINSPLIVKTMKFFHQWTPSIKDSCGKYFDAIAKTFSRFYTFPHRFASGATIEDVLDAKETGDWDFLRALKSYEQIDCNGKSVRIAKGEPIFNKNISDLYTADEWDKMNELKSFVHGRVPSRYPQLSHLSNGKPYIIIPHSQFTKETISILKNIGLKDDGLFYVDDLQVLSDRSVNV